MKCSTCRGETPDDKPFCANCGVPVALRCAACGADLLQGKPFCASCGQAVSTSTPSPLVATPETPAWESENEVSTAERRLCSVLFVDLVGFTTLAEQRDPEHVREILTIYFDHAQRIVNRYGGTVEKFIGDAVMAVWGAPLANEDDAERAVRAGLEMIEAVNQLGGQANLPGLRARGGIVTGEVAITVGRVSEGMVLGDTVNSASRIQSVADPGTVLVDESTWRAASGAVAFEHVGELDLRGKSATVNAWRALRVVAQRRGLGRSEQLEPPFVGREEEIRLIKDLLHVTSREERARLVSVTGIPGIGKSRLAWEFLKYVDGLADDVFWHQGRSRAYGEGISFGALSEMVRMRAGIVENDDPATALEKLHSCLVGFVTDEDERQWIEPRMAHLLGLADAPTKDREELFSAWRIFFERVAAQGATVLVFEDLHWADAGLVDFVESILEWSKNVPIMILTLARPELIERRPAWGAGVRNFTSLHLDALSTEAMRALLDGLVHGLHEDVLQSVLERAAGVPLYAVETIRMMVERDVLVNSPTGFVVQGDFRGLDMPETLHALVASRLDGLPVRQRTLLQDAGVVGSSFTLESLVVVSQLTRDELEHELRDLVRREYVAVNNDSRSPDRGQYSFVQGVIREVAVGTLGRRERQGKHLAIAKYAESQHDDELAGVVAAHYLEAYRATPEDSNSQELMPKALEWLQRAASRALSLGSVQHAVQLYEEALELAEEPHVRAPIYEQLSEAKSRLQEYGDAITYLEEAVAIYDGLGDENAWGLAVAAQALPLRSFGRPSEAEEKCRGAYAKVQASGSALVRAKLCEAIAGTLAVGSNVEQALVWCERALQLAESLDDASLLANALGNRSLALFTLGRHREAVLLARGVAAIADESGDLSGAARARTGLSLYMMPDDPMAAVIMAREAVELARRAGQRSSEITNLLNSAESALYLGLWDEVRQAFYELRQTPLIPSHLEWMRGLEAMLAAMEGDSDRADLLLREGEVALNTQGGYEDELALATTRLISSAFIAMAGAKFDVAYRDANHAIELDPVGINSSGAMVIAARAALWQGDVEKLQQVHAATARLRGRFIGAQRYTCEAGIAALRGEDSAVEMYRNAIEQWRALNNVLEIANCELDIMMLLGPQNVDPYMAKEAREIFDRIGATAMVRRLDQLEMERAT